MAGSKKGYYRPLDEDDVTPEQQKRLLIDPEASEARTAERVGRLAVFPGMKLRGRRRVIERNPGSMDFNFPATMPAEQVQQLGEALRGKQPVLGKFNIGYSLDELTPAVLKRYVHGSVARNKRQPSDPNDSREVKIIAQNKRREVEKAKNLFQQDTYEKYKTAQLYRASLDLVRKQAAGGQELDEGAAVWSAQAVIDFGASLDEGEAGKTICQELHDESLGMKIRYIGELASEDPAVLTQNPELLRLVQLEQAARVEFWGEHYELSTRTFIHDRLTNAQREAGEFSDAEVVRLRQLASVAMSNA